VAASAGALGLSAAEADSTGDACPMSHVLYRPSAGVDAQGLRSLPWIISAPAGRFTAHLFFYASVPWRNQHLLGARIFTTRKPRNVNPKVLWITRTPGYSQTLTMRGQRLDAPGSFTTTYRGFGDYPSYVNVPAPGCWRVTVTSGHATGSVVFSATD
jgi:hypothetical protein